MKRSRKVLIGISVFIIAIGAVGVSLFLQQMNDIDSLYFSPIDMFSVEDGQYEGKVSTTLIKAEVRVEVKDHEIENVTILEHINGMGGKAETIIEQMKEKNSYDVDSVSGATLSCQVIESAVNQALEKGVQ